MDHVHAAGEPILAGGLRGQFHGGLGEGRQVGGDAEVGEYHPGGAVPGLLPVEHKPDRHPRPGVDAAGRVAAAHPHPDLLGTAGLGRLSGWLGPEEPPAQAGSGQHDRCDHNDIVHAHRRTSTCQNPCRPCQDIVVVHLRGPALPGRYSQPAP